MVLIMEDKNNKKILNSKNPNIDELLKLVLILQLLEKLEKNNLNNFNCKSIEKKLQEVLSEIKTLKEDINSKFNTDEWNEILEELRELKEESSTIQTIKEILKENKKELEILIEERSNLVLSDLEEILRNNYTNLVKLIDEVHNSLAVKLIGALIFFLAGVIAGSWIERFVANKIFNSIKQELNQSIENNSKR